MDRFLKSGGRMGGWIDGWEGVTDGFRIAYNNKKYPIPHFSLNDLMWFQICTSHNEIALTSISWLQNNISSCRMVFTCNLNLKLPTYFSGQEWGSIWSISSSWSSYAGLIAVWFLITARWMKCKILKKGDCQAWLLSLPAAQEVRCSNPAQETYMFDCCKQFLKWLLNPPIHPSTHPPTHLFIHPSRMRLFITKSSFNFFGLGQFCSKLYHFHSQFSQPLQLYSDFFTLFEITKFWQFFVKLTPTKI